MKRRPVTAIAVAATFTLAAAAITVQSSSAGGPHDSIDAAHAPGTAPIPGPGTAPVAAGASLAASGQVPLLRPDMFSLRAKSVQMRGSSERRVLRFAALLANGGAGPMLVRPRPRMGCPAGQRHARQLIYVDRNNDGRFQRQTETETRSRPAGCMLNHPTHDHWHFDAMAAYRLVDPSPRRLVSGREKVSFCLRDNQPIPGTSPRQRRAYYGECSRTRVQGISPGWYDLYGVETPGQSIRIPRTMPDGVYCLVTRADPRDQLLETNERNNARALPLRIRGMQVSRPDTTACRGVIGRTSDLSNPALP